MHFLKLNSIQWLWVWVLLLHTACSTSRAPLSSAPDIVVIYENDVHCAVDGYAKLAALKQQLQQHTPYVTTVSNGDFLQGGVMGALTRGASIVRIMNAVGYDYLTLGNHEFDYGMKVLQQRISELKTIVLDANFRRIDTQQPVYQPYTIVKYGKVKVAYLGLTTPTVMESAFKFCDEQRRLLYTFLPGDELHTQVQQLVDKARAEGADYVVVLSHLGDVPTSPVIDNSSIQLIRHTRGIDVVLDGHAHSVIADSLVTNAQGKKVHLSSTGSHFQNLGVMTIAADGTLHTRLIETSAYSDTDEAVQQLVEQEQNTVMEEGKQVLFHSSFPLSVQEGALERAVRCKENPLANLICDAYRQQLGTDLCLINGGAFRVDLPAGDVTRNDLVAIMPFMQHLYTADITGQQLLDALECASMLTPIENGGFQQVSGLTYTIDTSKKTQIEMDANGMFERVNEGSPRRITDVKVLDKSTGRYEPLQLQRTYTLVSNAYLLRDWGSSAIYRYTTNVKDTGIDEFQPIVDYVQNHFQGVVPDSYRQADGRITILE